MTKFVSLSLPNKLIHTLRQKSRFYHSYINQLLFSDATMHRGRFKARQSCQFTTVDIVISESPGRKTGKSQFCAIYIKL